MGFNSGFKGLNAKLDPICHLLALLGVHYILHVNRKRVNGGNKDTNQNKNRYEEFMGHAAGGAVGSGTALQTERSRVLFLMVSLEFFIDIILPAAL